MKIPKPSDADKERFRSLVPDHPKVETKPMFGNLAGFVNGNMFMGLFGSSIGVRLHEKDRDTLHAIDGSGPFGPEDRPMKEYVTLPMSWLDNKSAEAAEWIGRALDHVAEMPPKQPKKKSPKKK